MLVIETVVNESVEAYLKHRASQYGETEVVMIPVESQRAYIWRPKPFSADKKRAA